MLQLKKYNANTFFYDSSFDEYDIKEYLLINSDFINDISDALTFIKTYSKLGYMYIYKQLNGSDINIPIGKYFPIIDKVGMCGNVDIPNIFTKQPYKLDVIGYCKMDSLTNLYKEIIVSHLVFKYT